MVHCPQLEGAAATGLVLGVVTLLLSFVCCLRCFKTESLLTHCICCSTISLLSLLFFVALIPNTVFVAQNIDFIRANGTISGTPCDTPVISLAVMGISYAMLPLFGLFCLCSFCLFTFKFSKTDE